MKKNYILLLLSILFVYTTNAQITLTQNTDNIITATNSVACPSGDNQQARLFDLANFGITSDFELTSGEIGVQTVGATFDVTVNVYDSNASFPTGFPGTLLGSQVVTIPLGSDGTIVSYNFSPAITIPATSTHVVVEVSQSDATSWFIGGTVSETATCFLKSATCSVASYSTPASIGFPDAHYYITVTGDLLGIDENSLQAVSVSPNPCKDFININMANPESIEKLELFDITGKRILNFTNTSKINISNLNNGVYMLRIQTDKGSVTKKIIKN
jgi:hypothetical protein